ncbi:FAD:protein FMN transferase [Chondromyces apiculatus]|uniref:FAD:protein FMN transferase n=1 Tax=Chondromyces apiculatus DSM 436 TaxID=1192034 RepID=A0A017T0C4_9BACT|nr:FAD:protein FMN transferase [Chondromyces apiculatus]EYF02310.1 Thiamin biosynthesis lipoprotein ApbE [Chondromyces apiculatus DSM 436]
MNRLFRLAFPLAALAALAFTACTRGAAPEPAPDRSASLPPADALPASAAPSAQAPAGTTPETPASAAPASSTPDITPQGSSAAAVAVPGTPSAAGKQAGRRVALETKVMGTQLTLATYTTAEMDEHALRPPLEKAVKELRRLESLMTTWRDDSEISQVNQRAGKSAVEVSPESLEVIQKSLWISRLSRGVFDITFEAMHGLWKFDEDLDDNIPSKPDVDRARKLIDYRQIQVDPAKRTVKLGKPGMRMNLGGIAKGYAVDAAARVLRAEGLKAFFIQAGGDLYVSGKKPDGSRFRVGVRDPRGKNANDFFAMIEVENHAFSTAGDYERSFLKDGKRYHHIIDPRTGFPATASRSVTIWAADALTADAIDDAVFILGPEEGLKLVESIDDCGAVIVDADNKVWISRRLEDKVHKLREPTPGL